MYRLTSHPDLDLFVPQPLYQVANNLPQLKAIQRIIVESEFNCSINPTAKGTVDINVCIQYEQSKPRNDLEYKLELSYTYIWYQQHALLTSS